MQIIPKDRLTTADDIWSIKLEIKIMSWLSRHPYDLDLKAMYEMMFIWLWSYVLVGSFSINLEKNGKFSEGEATVI